jgi:hypothetical protein
MKRLLVLAGIVLALITTTNQALGGLHGGTCKGPIIVSN